MQKNKIIDNEKNTELTINDIYFLFKKKIFKKKNNPKKCNFDSKKKTEINYWNVSEKTSNKLNYEPDFGCNLCKFINKIINFFFINISTFINSIINKKYMHTLSTNSLLTIYIDSENQDLLGSSFNLEVLKLLGSGEISIEKIYSFTLLFQILIFFLLVIVGLQFIPKLLSNKVFSIEKLTSYECGFAPFSSKSIANELHYLVVGIIFLVFDLEIIFIVPFIIKSVLTDSSILIVLVYFLIISTTVAIELKSGAISWPIWLQVNKKANKLSITNNNNSLNISWTYFLDKK